MATARTWRCDVGDSRWDYCGRSPLPEPKDGATGAIPTGRPEFIPPSPSRASVDVVLGKQQVHGFLAEGLRRR